MICILLGVGVAHEDREAQDDTGGAINQGRKTIKS